MIEKISFTIFVVTIVLVSNSFVQNQKHSKPDFFLVSVWYSGGKARAPMLSTITPNSRAEWKRDLEQIKSLGFNTVRTWVEWAHCEPRPGEYHFENLKLLCELAQEVGLKVIIQMYVDSAPDWVGKKFPDGLFEAQSGDKVYSQAAPGFCTDHAGVREAVLNFYTETAKVAMKYPNFHGWDLWSEPHIVNWAYINYVPNVQFCFCPNTQARFRQWLKQKYQTLTGLNQAWYRNFESWDDVQPPRFGTILSYTDFIDWKNFIYEKLAGDLRMRYEAVRRADKTHVITSHAAVPSIFYSPNNGYGATDDFLMAEQVDFYGTSLYPKHNHPARHWELWKFMVAVDFSRSANIKNGGFYVGEMQAGKGTIGLQIGNPITPDDHRIWMWSAVARGAKAINIYAYYPMSSGYESGGYGLINLDGSITERARCAGQIARIIDEHKKLFLESNPVKAEIAIVYNPLAQMVGGEQRGGFDGHQNSLIGFYRFFAEHNVPVDFIHRKDLESGNISQYKLIIVPYPLMFSQKAADGLKDFVKQGGYAVAEARLAWNDERGFAAEVIPGMGLSEVFGVIETKVKMSEQVVMNVLDNSHPVMKNLSKGDPLKGAYFAESIEPLNNSHTQILASLDDDGTPCIVASKYGRGETVLIGSFLGLANHPVSDHNNNQFLLNLLDWAKIVRPFTTSHDGKIDTPVEVRLQENRDGYLLFIINHNETSEDIDIRLNVNRNVDFFLHKIIQNEVVMQKSENNLLNFNMNIATQGVQIIKIY